MISYSTSFISNYYESLENKTLDIKLQDCLNSILNAISLDMSLNSLDNDLDYRFKKTRIKTKVNDNYYQQSNHNSHNSYNSHNSHNSSLKKKQESKTKIELLKSTIKSILNKLSPSNYKKLEQELITMYIQLLNNCIETNNNETIDYIDSYIINYVCYNNVSYSNIYVNIVVSIFSVYYNKNQKLDTLYIYNLLLKSYENFLTFDNIIKYNTSTVNDDFSINKNNDKYKCFIIFIINLYKKLYSLNFDLSNFYSNFFLNHNSMSLLFLHFNKFFIKNLELENNKAYCETIQEFLVIFYNELLKDIQFVKIIDCDSKILDDIKLLLLNNNNYPSFTNKIKFKLMNICDKYETSFKT